MPPAVVAVQLRTMQAVISSLLHSPHTGRWLEDNSHRLQFDGSNVFHAYGFRFSRWAEGRIPVDFRGETYYFDSELIYALLCFVNCRRYPSPTGVGITS